MTMKTKVRLWFQKKRKEVRYKYRGKGISF